MQPSDLFVPPPKELPNLNEIDQIGQQIKLNINENKYRKTYKVAVVGVIVSTISTIVGIITLAYIIRQNT